MESVFTMKILSQSDASIIDIFGGSKFNLTVPLSGNEHLETGIASTIDCSCVFDFDFGYFLTGLEGLSSTTMAQNGMWVILCITARTSFDEFSPFFLGLVDSNFPAVADKEIYSKTGSPLMKIKALKVMPNNPKESNVMKIVFSRKELAQKINATPEQWTSTTLAPIIDTTTDTPIARNPFKRTIDESQYAPIEPDSDYAVTGILISYPFETTTTSSVNTDDVLDGYGMTMDEADAYNNFIDEEVLSPYVGLPLGGDPIPVNPFPVESDGIVNDNIGPDTRPIETEATVGEPILQNAATSEHTDNDSPQPESSAAAVVHAAVESINTVAEIISENLSETDIATKMNENGFDRQETTTDSSVSEETTTTESATTDVGIITTSEITPIYGDGADTVGSVHQAESNTTSSGAISAVEIEINEATESSPMEEIDSKENEIISISDGTHSIHSSGSNKISIGDGGYVLGDTFHEMHKSIVSTENSLPAIDTENVGSVQLDTTGVKTSTVSPIAPEATSTTENVGATHNHDSTTTPRSTFNFFSGAHFFNPHHRAILPHPTPLPITRMLRRSHPPPDNPFIQNLMKVMAAHNLAKNLFVKPATPVNSVKPSGNPETVSTIWNFNSELFEPKKVQKRETDVFVTPSPRRGDGTVVRPNLIGRLRAESSVERAERHQKAVERLMHVATVAGHFDNFLTGRLKHGVKTLHKLFSTDEVRA